MDPYTLAYLAGYSDFSTTKRYVHPQKESVLAAMAKVAEVRDNCKSGYSGEFAASNESSERVVIN